MPDTRLHKKLQPHVGGLVRLVTKDSAVVGLSMGKIGLLLSAGPSDRTVLVDHAVVKLLIDGSVRILFVYPDELELIGAEAGER